MNIGLFRLRPLLRELKGIRGELQRMNDIRETELAYQGLHIKPPIADTRGPEPETLYTDEAADAIREMQEELGKIAKEDT